jgi:hypothetical protein
MNFSEDNLRQAVREGVARMRERRRAEQTLAEAAREYPEMAAREMLAFARTEWDRLRRQLRETFGFSVSREGTGFRCRFASPELRPRTPEEAARWIDAADDAEEFEARRKELAKRLAAKQAEKDRYVRAYAQGHISEEELDAYLAELKEQIDNLRVLVTSVEAELSERQERKSLTDTTQAWLLSLRRRLADIEEDTPEGFEKRKQLVGSLVESISLGRSQEGGRAEVQITYRFGPPPASDAESYSGSSMPGFKNGRALFTTNYVPGLFWLSS